MLKREETFMDEDQMSSEGYEADSEMIQNQWLITEANELGGPSARAGHSLVSFSGRLYLFGGFCNMASYLSAHAHMGDPAMREINQNAMPHFNSVHEYSFETRSWRVLHQGTLEHTPSVPKARRHASVVAHGNSLFVYGGFDADDKVLSDLWEFNIMQCTWERVKYSQFARALPPVARAEHTAVVYENKMIVFGGYDGKKKLNDTFVYDFAAKEWSRPSNAEYGAPSRRCKHTAVLYNSHMYVLGGFQFNSGDNYALTDMHHLDLETYVWSSVLMNKGSPEALQGHKAVVCGDVMYVLGGKVRAVGFGPNADVRSSGLNQSVFRYHFDTYKWSELPLTGTLPTPRQLHAAVTVNRGNGRSSILVFGGTDKAKQAYFRDLCELRGIRNSNELDHLPCANCISTRRLLNKELFSDVHFLVEGKKVYAHRCILYARSEYFRTMFESNMRESSLLEIPIPGVTYDTFLAVMEYLYACRVSVTDGRLAVELLKAADMFRLEGLRAHCVKKVEKAVTVENVAFICEIADTHNAEHLKQYCFTFIMRNFKRVINSDSWQSLLRQDPGGLGREILEAYSDSNPYLGSAHKRARK